MIIRIVSHSSTLKTSCFTTDCIDFFSYDSLNKIAIIAQNSLNRLISIMETFFFIYFYVETDFVCRFIARLKDLKLCHVADSKESICSTCSFHIVTSRSMCASGNCIASV